MEIRHLKYFLAVAREGSLTAAAAALHVTQPTLSRQLNDLEAEVGQKLFDRSTHSVTLTPEGFLLRRRAEDILELTRKAVDEMKSCEEEISGTVSIGAGEALPFRHVAKVMSEINRANPKIVFDLHSGNAEDVIERLDKGLIDFGIVIQPVDTEKYDSLDIPDPITWGVVLPKDHQLAAKKSVTRTDLRHEPLVLTRRLVRDARVKNPCAKWFGADWKNLRMVATNNLFYNSALLAKAGIGILVTIDGLLDIEGTSGLVFRPLSPPIESRFSVIWKRYVPKSPASRLFLERLEAELKT